MGPLLNMGDALRAYARIYPDRPGARDLSRSMTFRQWNARACRLANGLIGLGLKKGDRFAVLAYNCVEWMEIYAAALSRSTTTPCTRSPHLASGNPITAASFTAGWAPSTPSTSEG